MKQRGSEFEVKPQLAKAIIRANSILERSTTSSLVDGLMTMDSPTRGLRGKLGGGVWPTCGYGAGTLGRRSPPRGSLIAQGLSMGRLHQVRSTLFGLLWL